jgi:cytoskeletal protein CcmA (bactofilin family)
MADSETPPAGSETPPAEDDVDALETPEAGTTSSDGGGDNETIDATSALGAANAAPSPAPKQPGGLKQKLRKFNLYLLLFVFILLIAGVILAVAYFQSKQASTTSTIKSQDLTQSVLQQVASSDATVGNSQQVLNVQSSAVFAGKVLIRDGLEIADGLTVGGNLQVSGTAALTGLAVSGSSQFGQVQVTQNLAVAGDSAVQGALTVSKSLQVSGGGTFSGPLSAPQITTSNLQLNSDLVLTHHITAGGPTPSLARGPSLGGGGTASVSGSDTSGSVSINIGSNPAAGCFATITFTSKFNATPHVLLTPTSADGNNSSAGIIDYYVTRDTGSFSICDSTAPPSGSSFGFDYFITD